MSARRRPVLERALTVAPYLASPDSGRVGQGIRFVITGGVVAVVYMTTTLVLSAVVGVPFQVALVTGYVLGLCVHFTLQRVFVWVHHEEFVLPLHQQGLRYLLVAGVQYGVTAAATAMLPSALDLSEEAVYVVVVAVVTAANFLVFGSRVFHARPPETGRAS
jgi:putative flippase GtrA